MDIFGNILKKRSKNNDFAFNSKGYYNEDIWGLAHKQLEPFLQDGMTLYYEIAGYLPVGAPIQKDYDYGHNVGEYGIYIYRITYTNTSGKVFEFSAKQVQNWCKSNGLNSVPELYYGTVMDLFNEEYNGCDIPFVEFTQDKFLELIKRQFNEKNCHMCNNKVPEEGCVIRIEGLEFEAYKAKSNRFYERETKLLDKGEVDIETEN